ncbi:hypothetical protein GJ496_004647 [Pomphorhynchus laevis]|nr:hypothetical protein GJ496_004647 [Pomphorhynchus laevis]
MIRNIVIHAKKICSSLKCFKDHLIMLRNELICRGNACYQIERELIEMQKNDRKQLHFESKKRYKSNTERIIVTYYHPALLKLQADTSSAYKDTKISCLTSDLAPLVVYRKIRTLKDILNRKPN